MDVCRVVEKGSLLRVPIWWLVVVREREGVSFCGDSFCDEIQRDAVGLYYK